MCRTCDDHNLRSISADMCGLYMRHCVQGPSVVVYRWQGLYLQYAHAAVP